ncbi:MAG: hypothetical protein P8Y64_07215 [Gammaproteobacteria bacterium]
MTYRSRLAIPAAAAALICAFIATSAQATTLPPDAKLVTRHTTPAQQQKLASLSLPFVQNTGQIDKRVAFYARTFAGTAFVTHRGELVLNLPGKPEGTADKGRPAKHGHGWVLTEMPVAKAKLTPQGEGLSPTNVSVFQGNDPRQWRTHLKTYTAVNIGQPWPGIGYAIHAHGNTVERIFTVQPGADAKTITMQVRGADTLSLDNGALIAHTGNGPVTLSKPVAYQTLNGQRKPVQVAYVLNNNRYGFKLGAYDKSQPVVIDPLVQATYLGGSANDDGYALTLGGSGQVYVAGDTTSADFPGTTGGAQPATGGNTDAFVAELSGDLTQLQQATYLGGLNDDDARALALGSSGQVYVAGYTHSANFPCTDSTNTYTGVTCDSGTAPSVSGAQPTLSGNTDAFVAELSGNLQTLTQATFLGGPNYDWAYALAVGSSGQVYVAGATLSTKFPVTSGGAQTTYGGGTADGFVAELDGNLQTLTQATFLGGSGNDAGYALALGGSGQVYVAGYTVSPNFPCTDSTNTYTGVTCDSGTAPSVSGAQPTTGGGSNGDAFVAELSSDLATIQQSTYLGGTGSDQAQALALGGSGQVYVAGYTVSTDFPGTSGGAQAANADSTGSTNDAFVADLSGNLQTLTQATYLGGSGNDQAQALALGGSGQVYVAGYTASTDFPGTSGGAQAANADSTGSTNDAFVAELSGDLQTLTQATYLGGSSDDQAQALAVGSSGQVYVAGYTASTDFPGTSGGAQAANASSSDDAFVAQYNGLAATSSSISGGGGGGGGALGPWALFGLLLPGLGLLRRKRLR